ncbi:MAG: ribonuclease H-like domain-containing protein [Bacteroidetes bacterium]|nr:ribonuclease H-like domain-containing protein [Bacteroidota bacterium]
MQNIILEHLLFIDIETVPQYGDYEQLSDDWKQLWEEKTIRTLPDFTSAAEFYPQRAGVMAEFAKIICISIGYFTRQNGTLQMRVKSFSGHDEKKLLQDFITTISQVEIKNNKWCFTGHNIKEFDIPFICRRLLINGLVIPSYLDFQNMKPWDTNIVDTFQYWRFGDFKNYTSLKLLAAALGVPSPKDDIDGSMVAEVYWKEKNLERIVIYCEKDVITTANIILKFKGMNLISNDDVIIVK